MTLRLLWPQWQGAGTSSIQALAPRETTQPLGDWLAATGCSRVAIHFDVDTIDSNELVPGLGAEPGISSALLSLVKGRGFVPMARIVGMPGPTAGSVVPRG